MQLMYAESSEWVEFQGRVYRKLRRLGVPARRRRNILRQVTAAVLDTPVAPEG